MHTERTYRNQLHQQEHLTNFRSVVKETDLYVRARSNLEAVTRESVLKHRGILEAFIDQHPEFSGSMVPLIMRKPLPHIITNMLDAARKASVGPMAAVAGAIAEQVGLDLLNYSPDVIIENGGDIFIHVHTPLTIGIFANRSPLNLRIGLRLDPSDIPIAVCTSSGTVGHSHSYGTADAVTVVSKSCPLADAAATAIGNQVDTKKDIDAALDYGKHIKGVEGVVIIKNDRAGLWGDLDIVKL